VNSKSHSREREKKRGKRYKKLQKTFGKPKEKKLLPCQKTLREAVSKAGLAKKYQRI